MALVRAPKTRYISSLMKRDGKPSVYSGPQKANPYGELCNLMLDDGSILIDNRVNGDQCPNRYPHPDHDNLLKRLKTATKEYNKACSFIAAMEIDKSNLLTMEEIQIKHSSAIKFINGLKLKTLIIESK